MDPGEQATNRRLSHPSELGPKSVSRIPDLVRISPNRPTDRGSEPQNQGSSTSREDLAAVLLIAAVEKSSDEVARAEVAAFLDGGYEQGPRRAGAIPEPSAMFLTAIAMLGPIRCRAR